MHQCEPDTHTPYRICPAILLAVHLAAALLLASCARPDAPATATPPASLTVGEAIPVGDFPIGIAVGAGAVWVSNGYSHTVTRLDPATRQVTATIRVNPGPAQLAFGAGSAWVATQNGGGERNVGGVSFALGSLLRIDPSTNTVVATIPIGARPKAVVADDRDVWVTNFDDGTVTRIDAGTNQSVATIRVSDPETSRPSSIALGQDAVWVAISTGQGGGENAVVRIDPAVNDVVARIPFGTMLADLNVAVGEGAVWVARNEFVERDAGVVARIDPAADQIMSTIPVGDKPAGIAVGEGAVWVTRCGDGTVVRIDPGSNTISDTATVGTPMPAEARIDETGYSCPGPMTTGHGAVWVANIHDDVVRPLRAPSMEN